MASHLLIKDKIETEKLIKVALFNYGNMDKMVGDLFGFYS